jgi:hypothetical protein
MLTPIWQWTAVLFAFDLLAAYFYTTVFGLAQFVTFVAFATTIALRFA